MTLWSSRPVLRLLAWSTIGWLTVGLLSGVQVYVFQTGADQPVPLFAALWAQVLAAVPWMPVTPFIILLARRFPPKTGGWLHVLAGHVVLGAAVVCVLNYVQAVLQFMGGCPVGCGPTVQEHFVTGILKWGHLGMLAYGILLGIAWWRPLRAAESTSATVPDESFAATLTVTVGRKRMVIPVDEIEWMEASGDYTSLHVGGVSRLCAMRLGELESSLDPGLFARVHRSAMVNLSAIRSYRPVSHGDYLLTLDSGQEVKLTRSRREEVLDRLRNRA